MNNVYVPDIQVSVFISGSEVCRIRFNQVDRSPQDWEITAAIEHKDSRKALRACLLAAAAELESGDWIPYSFSPEVGSEADDQPPLPF